MRGSLPGRDPAVKANANDDWFPSFLLTLYCIARKERARDSIGHQLHNPYGPLATAVCVHIDLASPNFVVQEMIDPESAPEAQALLMTEIDPDGRLSERSRCRAAQTGETGCAR